ncbi:MAG TPA: CheR family methyltransferase, partial [Puia sp.]|nr:CheR family methyltransferase [Puia sp.]
YKLSNLKEYIKFIRKKPDEIDILLQDLFINVTSFFRDRSSFDYLEKNIFPKLVKDKSPTNPLRIWVCACATGEEAYSIAISVVEFLGDNQSNITVQIFATDISELSIIKARNGEYGASELHNLEPAQIQRFFSKVDGSYRINKSIRDMCIFAPHNVFADPPYSRIDLISCCNLLIYLDNVLQNKILSIFHYSLIESGYLVLGRSETISSSPLFTHVNSNHKIYLKKKNTSAKATLYRHLSFPIHNNSQNQAAPNSVIAFDELNKVFDSFLLSSFVPACVVINQQSDILQFRGETSFFLRPSQGKASLNILKMIHPDLTFDLRTAILKSIKSKQAFTQKGIEMKKGNTVYLITIQVVPLKGHFDEPFFAVMFTEDPAAENLPITKTGKKANDAKDQKIKKLEELLASSKSDMQLIFEVQKSANEELQSANEEVVSSNEELQSINEELETSKEEIESINEELLTTNQELQTRNEQLSESYGYIDAVLSTIHEPFIVLDKNIRVRSANRAFYKKFQTSEKHIEGMYFFDISDQQWNLASLRELLLDIIPTNSFLNNFEVSGMFPGSGQRKFLLNAHRINQKNFREHLIFLAFEDITEREIQIQKQTDISFKKIADSAPVMLWVTNANGMITFLNRAWIDFTGLNINEDKKRTERIHTEDISLFLTTYNSAVQLRKEYTVEFRLSNQQGQYHWMSERAIPKFSVDGNFEGFIGSCVDINDMKEHEQRKEDFIRMASHELKTPITTIRGYVELMLDVEDSENLFVKSSLKTVHKQIEKLSKLIGDLLDMTKIETSAFHLNNEFFDMDAHIKDVVEETKQLYSEHAIIFQHEDKCTVYADKDRITQVIINLLTNAAKYSPGKKEIIVAVKCDEEKVTVSVKDFGIGISKIDQARIFERFYRSHEKYEKTFPGFGIGLFIASEIIKLHSGKIWVESEKNKGSVFYFELPLRKN